MINIFDYQIQTHWFDAELLSKKLGIDFSGLTEKKKGRQAIEIMSLYLEVKKQYGQTNKVIYQKVLQDLFICEAALKKEEAILNDFKEETMKEDTNIEKEQIVEEVETNEVINEDMEIIEPTEKVEEKNIENEPIVTEKTNWITKICVWLSDFLKDANILILPLLVLTGFQSFHLATVIERISEHSVWVAWLCAIPIELVAVFSTIHATKKSYGLIDSISNFAWAQFVITLLYCEFWKVDNFQDMDSVFLLICKVIFGGILAYALYIYSEIFVTVSKEK